MLILAVETSGREGGIALTDEGTTVASRSMSKGGPRHAQALVQDVADALRDANRQPAEIDVIAVSIGPGSFTGLRVGVVFAKTWCYAAGSRLVTVDTLAAAAAQVPQDVERVFAIADAQRGDLYVGDYHRGNQGELSRIGEISVVNAEQFAAERSAGEFVTGPGLERYDELFGPPCRVADSSQRHPTAETVARLGAKLADAGDFADFWALEPFYIRKSAAEEKWEARPAES